MPKHRSRILEKAVGRQFEGEAEGALLVSWLNGERAYPAEKRAAFGADKRRIVQLLTSLRELPDLIAAAHRPGAPSPTLDAYPFRIYPRGIVPMIQDNVRVERWAVTMGAIQLEAMSRGDFFLGAYYFPMGIRSRTIRATVGAMIERNLRSMDEPLRALTSLLLKLYRMMRRYPSHLALLADPTGGVEWQMVGHRSRGVTLGEYDAVSTIAELGRRRLLDRVRQCPICAKWIFAKFSHQRFCSESCRIKEFRSSAEWKAHARRKARERYHEKKKAKRRTRT